MSGLGESNSDILVLVQRAQNKALKIINFKEERLPSEPLFTETKILNLTNIITLNNYMLVFDHLNSGPPAMFVDLLIPFNEEHSHNTMGARRCFKYPKNENLFLWFQVSSG